MASPSGKVTVPVKPAPWKEGDRDVPAVLGHDEGQPAYGVAVKAWREGDKLKADIVNIPGDVASAIKAGGYFQTSAEVYDDTGEAGLPAGGGCMLRRIALLGSDIPQVKTLADLPKPGPTGDLRGVEIFACGTHRGQRYTEKDLDAIVKNFERYSAPAVKFSNGQLRHKIVLYRKHSEVAMDRQRIIDALVAAGMDMAKANALDDATLEALQPVCENKMPGSQAPEMMADDADVDDALPPVADDVQTPAADAPATPVPDEAAADSPEFDRTSIIAQLVGKGLDPNELNALSDDDLKMRLQQVNATESPDGVSANGEDTVPDAPVTTPGAQPDIGVAPQKLSKMSAKKYAEQQVSALHQQLQAAKAQIDKTLAQSARDVKLAKFEAFKERLRGEGRLVPALEEAGLLDDFVETLDHSTVKKFGEKKRTQFDMLQELLSKLPRVVKFGETVKSSKAGLLKASEDEGQAKDNGVQEVRARYRQFSEKFHKMGLKEEEMVQAYESRKARNPLTTADDIIKI